MNTIILSKADFADALKDCVEGESKTISVTIHADAVNDRLLAGTVTAAAYEATEETPAEEVAAEDTATKPYRPKARKGAATAVEY